MNTILRLIFATALLCLPLRAQQQIPPYKDAKLSLEDRVADLLSRMTLEEKVAQISGGGNRDAGLIDTTGKLPYKNAEEVFKALYNVDNRIGPRDWAFPLFFSGRACTDTWRMGARVFRKLSDWPAPGIQCW
jgi:hypothetical protein